MQIPLHYRILSKDEKETEFGRGSASLGLGQCPKCGAKNPAGVKFCGECGTKIV